MKEIKITDIKGFQVGQVEGQKAGTGCTVILCRDGTVAGVSIRGGGPATRETDLLHPINMIQEIYAVMLSGGSTYDLDAASGAIQYLEEHDTSFNIQVVRVPIVCGVNLFDLSVSGAHVRPDKEMDYATCVDAEDDTILGGNHGAGTEASVGKLLSFEHVMKGGIEACGIQVGDLRVVTIIAVNICGNAVDYETDELLAGVYDSRGGSVLKTQGVLFQQMDALRELPEGSMTVGCFVTNAKFDKAQCTKIAGIAHNGYARAIHPVHIVSGGNSTFMLSNGEVGVMADAVGMLATEMVAKTIKHAILHAESAYGLPAHSGVMCK